MTLTRDAILAADDLPRERVEVPEWGGEVYLRAMTGTEREAYEGLIADREKAGPKGAGMSAVELLCELVARTACDELGLLLFEPADIPALKTRNATVLVRLSEQAMRMNRLTEMDIKDLEKNSGGGPSDDSTSASPSSAG